MLCRTQAMGGPAQPRSTETTRPAQNESHHGYTAVFSNSTSNHCNIPRSRHTYVLLHHPSLHLCQFGHIIAYTGAGDTHHNSSFLLCLRIGYGRLAAHGKEGHPWASLMNKFRVMKSRWEAIHASAPIGRQGYSSQDRNTKESLFSVCCCIGAGASLKARLPIYSTALLLSI